MQLTDQEILQDAIVAHKFLMHMYCQFGLECSNATLRNLFEELHKVASEHDFKIFKIIIPRKRLGGLHAGKQSHIINIHISRGFRALEYIPTKRLELAGIQTVCCEIKNYILPLRRILIIGFD